jgi:hypothetical protein
MRNHLIFAIPAAQRKIVMFQESSGAAKKGHKPGKHRFSDSLLPSLNNAIQLQFIQQLQMPNLDTLLHSRGLAFKETHYQPSQCDLPYKVILP